MRIRSFAPAALAAVAISGAAVGALAADDVEGFYRGKRITILSGSDTGGGYDTAARLVGRHLGRHIPGNPSVIVQSMPGAGSVVATNYMVNVADKDGSVIGALQRTVALVQFMGQKGTKYKAEELNWLGSLAKEAGVCAVATRTGVASFDDVFKREFAMGGTGANTSEFHPALFRNLLGASFKLIRGYPGSAHVHLAIQNGELDGVCQSWASFKELAAPMLKDGKIKPLVQVALQPEPELKAMGVPMLADFITADRVAPGLSVEDVRTFFRLTLVPGLMGRPFAVAPGVPAERVKALRTAFAAMSRDNEFTSDARRLARDIEFVSGEEIQDLVVETAKAPMDKMAALDEHLKFKGAIGKAKLQLLRHSGKVIESERKGAQIVFDLQGKKTPTTISSTRTRIIIDGKAAERGMVKAGMTCSVAYFGPGTQAEELSCTN